MCAGLQQQISEVRGLTRSRGAQYPLMAHAGRRRCNRREWDPITSARRPVDLGLYPLLLRLSDGLDPFGDRYSVLPNGSRDFISEGRVVADRDVIRSGGV